MKLEVRAIPQAPLHFADRHGAGNHSGTLDYLPGTAWRGALAMTYLNRADLQRQITSQLQTLNWSFESYFNWLFLSGCVRFPNLYPERDRPSLVIPLSARSCKRFKGFVGDPPRPEPPHGVVDELLLDEPGDLRCPAQRKHKSACFAPMEPIHGFYESADGQVKGARRVSVGRRALMRTAMENATETVRSGMLYSLEAIEEGGGGFPTFSGFIQAEAPPEWSAEQQDALLRLLRTELEREELTTLRLGAAKTRGLGTVEFEIQAAESFALLPLEERFDRLQEVWRQIKERPSGQKVFTLTLNADAIVLDDLWRFRSRLDESVLAREIPHAPPFKLQRRCFTQTRVVSGWNSAHQLPKEDELAIVKGAAFLYCTEAERGALLAWLHQVEKQGIGERRAEGFGQVIVCHPFHWEVPKR